MIKLTYSILIFYITLCLPAQLFTALSNPITHSATEHKKCLNAEFKQLLDIEQLKTAITKQDHDTFDQIISQNPGIVSYKNPKLNSLLHLATDKYNLLKDSEGLLHLAAYSGNKHAVQKLLNLNIDPDFPNCADSTALLLASHNGHLDIIKILHSKNAKHDLKNAYGTTAIMAASERGHLDAVKELIQYANPNTRDRDGKTALDLARDKVAIYPEIITILETSMRNTGLIANDINNHNFLNFNGETDLTWASRLGHLNWIKELLSENANPYRPNKHGQTALEIARNKFSNYTQIVTMLQEVTSSESSQTETVQKEAKNLD